MIVPLVLYNKFSTPDIAIVTFNNNWGLSDIFLRIHYRIFQNKTGTRGISLIPYITLPSGDENDYISDHYPRGGLKIAADWKMSDKWYAAMNLGAEGREFVNLLNYSQKGRILMSAGLAYLFTDQVSLMIDVVSSTAIEKPFTETVTTPVEGLFGLNAQLKKVPIAFNLNGGIALIRGAGTPLFRTLAGMTIRFD
ncbi:transporter [bacterium]|nr:transporter [bacterium]MBU1917090.1 transporter [bacterium]